MLGSLQISKDQFYRGGGFADPRHWRRQRRGVWQYFRRFDD